MPLPTPYHRGWMSWYLDAHAVPGVEQWSDGAYTRTVAIADGPALVCVRLCETEILVSMRLPSPGTGDEVLGVVRRLLALDDNNEGSGEVRPPSGGAAADRLLSSDPALRDTVRAAPGVRVPGAVDGWELLLRTMIGQQISLAAARTHLGRLASALGEPVEEVWRLMPRPEVVASRGASVLTGPSRRVAAVIGAAARVAEGRLDLSADRGAGELRAALLAVPGIGLWTADYVVMRLCRESDILLSTDLVARQGAVVLGIDLTDSAHTASWSPFRSVATMHLWRAALAAR